MFAVYRDENESGGRKHYYTERHGFQGSLFGSNLKTWKTRRGVQNLIDRLVSEGTNLRHWLHIERISR